MADVKTEEKEWLKEFSKCPGCGSENRFFEEMVKEMKESGKAKDDFNFRLQAKAGVIANESMLNSISIGSEMPGFYFETDICEDCGMIYAVKIQRKVAKKTIQPAIIQQPNRGERRRQLYHPGINN